MLVMVPPIIFSVPTEHPPINAELYTIVGVSNVRVAFTPLSADFSQGDLILFCGELF
jgi:hypothetical protein